MQTHAQSVAANIRAEMARRRATQGALAAALGVTQQAVSRRLRGDVEFTVTELQIVAETLGVDPARLLTAPPSPARSVS